MKNKIIKSALLIIIILYIQVVNIENAFAQAIPPQIHGEAVILFDMEHGQILYQKGSSLKLHISLSNKLMTALLAIESIKPGQKIPASKEAINADGSMLNLEAGEKYLAQDLVTAIMLTSANDAANVISEVIGGSTKEFVALMNKKANALHMSDTVFKNPTGLYNSEQYTTAKDLYLLLKYALKNPEFERLFTTKGLPFNDLSLINSNKLIWRYEGAEGGKAGYNEIDKQSAATLVSRSNRTLISIVLFGEEDAVWSDSISLLDFGFNNFMRGAIVQKGGKLRTAKAYDTTVNLISNEDVFYTYPYDESNIQKVEFATPDELKPPITKNVPQGNLIYTLKDQTIITIPLFPDKEVIPAPTVATRVKDLFKESKDLMYLVAFLILIEIILIIYKIVGAIRRSIRNRTRRT